MTDRNFEAHSAGFEPFDAAAFNNPLSVEALRKTPHTLSKVRHRLEEDLLLVDLAERVYLGGFVADAKAAAVSLSSLVLSSTDFDIQSFGEDVTKQEADNYLQPFREQDTVSHHFPRLWLPAAAVIPYGGKELTLAPNGFPMALIPYDLGSFFSPDIRLPQLVDRLTRTFDQLEEVSQFDPDHPKQLQEAYQMAVSEQREKHPTVRFQEPVIIRAVATLPVGREYMTDFLPQIELVDRDTVWAPRLLVGGTLSAPCDYLYTDAGYTWDRVTCSSNVKGTALRVTRPMPGERDAERGISTLPLVNHEDYSMAVILFPYELKRTPRPSLHSFNEASGEPLPGYNAQASVGNVAIVGASTDRFSSVEHEKIGIFNNTIVPKDGGQPLIYSVRFFTVSAQQGR